MPTSRRIEDPDFPDRVNKVEKALYGLHQTPRAWYETLSTYLLDNGFQREKIDKTLFIKRDKGDILLLKVYVDDIIFGSTKKELCSAFEKLMYEKFQMSSMGELTFFLRLQVKQKNDGIFISQDKYVAKILKKFRFIVVKTASTPMETQKPLLKDKDGEEVDVHMYRSVIGSLMYLTSLRPDIMFAVCACARYQVNLKVSHLYAVKMIFRYLKGQPKLGLWYLKDSLFDLVAYTDSDYAGASLDRKSTTGGKAKKSVRLMMEKLFEMELELILFWSTTMAKTIYEEVQLHAQVDGKEIVITELSVRRDLQLADEEGLTMPIDPHPTPTILQPSTQPQKKQKPRKPKRKDTQVPQPSDPTDNVVDEAVHKELGDNLVRAATTISSLEAEQDSGGGPRCQETMGDTIAQTRFENASKLSNDLLLAREDKDHSQMEIASLKRRVKKLEKRNRSRTHKLKRLYEGRIDDIDTDDNITLVNVYDDVDDEMFDVNDLGGEEVLLQVKMKKYVDASAASKILLATTDKGKGIMIEEPVKPKKKDQIRLDEETALKLQAEFDEEERLAREKDEKDTEANIAFIEEWDDIQAKIVVDHQLAERLQAQEQEELSDAKKATLFQQLLEKRRKHFAA
ncbi:uncharacterized mitochondrial protein-like protein [Tanacetum coccineum]